LNIARQRKDARIVASQCAWLRGFSTFSFLLCNFFPSRFPQLKIAKRALRTIAFCVAAFLFASATPIFADGTWSGGDAANGNWSDNDNWVGNAQPNYGTLTFSGSTRTTNTDDNITAENKLLWTGSSAWTLNQGGSTVLSLFDNGGTQAKIENQSSGLVTINLPITFAATTGAAWGEINAVNGGLTFGTGTLTVNGSAVNGIKMFGGGQTTTFNNTVSATGKWFGMTATNDIMAVGGAFTSGDIYVMNGGTLKLNSGGTITTSALRLGGDFGNTGNQNQTLGGTLQFTNLTGGQSFASVINTVSGNTSGALLIDSQNTSNTNTISGNIFLDSNLRVQQATGGTLAITNATLDLKGNTLSLNTGATGNAALLGNINITGVIGNSTGSGQLVVGTDGVANSGGTVTLSNTNTYSGQTFVRNGTLAFTSAGSSNSSTIRLGSTSGTSVDANINLTTLAGGTTIGSVINPVGTSGSGNLTLNSQNTSGTNTLSNHIGLDRNFTITEAAGSGTLNITQAHTDGATNGTGYDIKGFTATFTPGAGSTINDSGTIYNSVNNGSVVMNGAGNLTFSGTSANTYTGLTTVSAGELDLNKTAGQNAIGGNLTINGGTVKWLADNQVADNASVILSSGSLQFNGHSETMNDITVSGTGTLTTGSTGTVQLNGSSLTLNGGTTNIGDLFMDNHTTVTAGANEVLAGGTLQESITGVTMNGGTLLLDASNSTPGTLSLMSNVTANDGTTSAISNNLSGSNAGAISLNGGTRTFNVVQTGSNGTTTLTISASIQGTSGALTKSGAGTLVLTGNNTYTGATTVNAGKLFVNGSTSSSSAVGVNNSGTTLGGSGTIGGTVTMNSSGTNLSPGASGVGSIGKLTVGALTMTTGNLNIDITSGGTNTGTGAGTVYDQVSFNPAGINATTINGATLVVSALSSALAVGNVYYIVDNTSTNADNYGTFTNGATVTDNSGDTFSINYAATDPNGQTPIANDISLTVLTVVPEPSTWVGGALALLLIGYQFSVIRRRRLAQSATNKNCS
jgi:fibronectin-binding autotransporter adhesin